MTEPGAGSDLQGIRTTARRDGDRWILNGQKTFISSGIMADVVVVAARTDPAAARGRSACSSWSVTRPASSGAASSTRSGCPRQDTAELFFHDAVVPAANLLGEEGRGLRYLMSHLPRERLGVTAKAIATTRAIFEHTVEYCRQRDGIRSTADRPAAHPFRARRDGHRDRHRRSLRRQVGAGLQRRRTDRRSTLPRASGTSASCRSGWSTAACSCTAAMAT